MLDNHFTDRFEQMSRINKLLLYLAGVLVFWIWYQATMNILYVGDVFPWEDLYDLGRTFLLNFPMLLLMCVGNTLIVFSIRFWRQRPIRVLIDFVLSALLVPIAINGTFLAISWCFGKTPRILWMQCFVLNFMIYMINEIIWFVGNYHRTRRVAVELEYSVLRMQVNPHFLFNSLNILYSLTHLDLRKSQEFVLALSRVYRHIMVRRDKLTSTLSDELEFLTSYVDVLKIHYFDAFELEIIRLIPDDEERHIVPYALQLLIENVTKHNVINEATPMKVTVTISNEGIKVSNPLRPRQAYPEPAKSTGVGLEYLNRVYALNHRQVRVSDADDRFTVTIPFLNN